MNDADLRRALGAFIRAHRERQTPPECTGRRRRTPGWRREELADAAGLGTTWITWLEQGRPVNASAAALTRIADALKLTPAERASMFDLAAQRDPRTQARPAEDLPEELLQLPHAFNAPAYLLDHGWNARAWNAAAAELFGGWLDDTANDCNLLAYVFLCDAACSLIADWNERARRLVAEFHADFNRRPDDESMRALVARLSERSALFDELWRGQHVLRREGGERRFHHPQRGELHFRQTTLLAAAQPDVKLVCLLPLD